MQQLRRGYLCDLSVAERRESPFEQPAILAESRFRATLAPLLAQELFGDFPEGVAPRGLVNFLQPPFEAGILTARQKLARGDRVRSQALLPDTRRGRSASAYRQSGRRSARACCRWCEPADTARRSP